MSDGWVKTDRGWRKRYGPPVAPVTARSDFPTPMMVRDFADPVQSMADGKWYGSKAALARSHKASGNPHGEDFIELGNEPCIPFREHVTDERAEREVIRQAVHDVENGWVPPAPVELD